MISSGLFVLPGLAYAEAGPGVILSYAIAAMLILPALLCQAELASAMPKAGATYVFIERSLGTFPGVFAGLASWFSLALKAAFALVGIGALARLVWPGAHPLLIKFVALGFCVGFTALNCLTVKGVGRAQIVMVAGLLVVLVGFVAFGAGSQAVRLEHFGGMFREGPLRIAATAGVVFVSFGGLTATADISGEVRRAARTVPLGMLSALVIVGLLYVASVSITVGVCPPEELARNYTPLSLAAGKLFGPAGVVILALAGMLAFVTTANGGILEASRSPLAMARDGLLPGFIQHDSRRFGTPFVSVLLTGGFMVLAITVLSIENLVKVASTMLLVLYALTCLSVLTMRQSRIQNYRPLFRAPLGPTLPLAGVVLYGFLIVDMGTVPLLTTAGFATCGLLWWLVYLRPRIRRESALVYMVRRLVAREIYRSDLEEELKHISLQRDEIEHDRFDRIIQNCEILDLPGPTAAKTLFRRAAELLAPRLGVDADDLAARLAKREKESSTILQPGLAIPHIIVPGKGVFDILPVRSRGGIIFEPDQPYVKTAFILAGSADERNYHLRALMAIAHITQEPDFASRWQAAPDIEHLRDLLLLSGRSRDHSRESPSDG